MVRRLDGHLQSNGFPSLRDLVRIGAEGDGSFDSHGAADAMQSSAATEDSGWPPLSSAKQAEFQQQHEKNIIQRKQILSEAVQHELAFAKQAQMQGDAA